MNIHADPEKTKPRADLGEFHDAGFALVLLSRPIEGDLKSGKRPLTDGWQVKPGATVKEAVAHMRSGGNVGLRPPKTHAVIDYDPRKVVGAEPATVFNEFVADFGLNLDQCTVVDSGGGGKHIYLRLPEHIALTGAVPGYHGAFEIKKHNGQVVAAGSVHGSGGVYSLATDVAPAKTSTIPDTLLDAIRKPARKTAADGGTHTPDDIAAMLSHLDPIQFRDHEPWFELFTACHHASGGHAMQEFIDWSISDPMHSNQAEAVEYRWDTLDPAKEGFTVKTLFKALTDAGHADQIIAKGEDLDSSFADLEDDEIDASKGASTINFINAADCGVRPQLPYVVKGLIAQGQSGAIIGEPGVGKSFLAPYLAHCIATASAFFGRKVRPCKVAYYAAEDGFGLELRIKALTENYGPAPDLDMIDDSLNLTDKSTRKALRKALLLRGTKMLVVDTLAMAFGGIKENDNGAEGMGVVLEAMKYFQDAGIGVVLVHHDSKAGDGVARGGSSLNGGFDWTLPLKRSKDVVSVRGNGKNRRGSPATDINYRIKGVALNLPRDEDGEPITSAVLAPVSGAEAEERKQLSKRQSKTLELVHKLCGDGGACSIDSFRSAAEELHAVSDASTPKARRDSAFQAAGELIELGRIVVDGDSYRIPGQGDEWSDVEAEPDAADLVAAFVAEQGGMSPRKLESSIGEIGIGRADLRDLVECLKDAAQGVETPSGVLIAEEGRRAGSIVIKMAEGSDLI